MTTLYAKLNSITQYNMHLVNADLLDDLYNIIGEEYVQGEKNDTSNLNFKDGKVKLYNMDGEGVYTEEQVRNGRIGDSGGLSMYATNVDAMLQAMYYFADTAFDYAGDSNTTLLKLLLDVAVDNALQQSEVMAVINKLKATEV
jgi:hypothetical protein